MRSVILHELLELMSSSPCRESLVLFVRTWNIWRDSDYTRRRRSRILTCFHFTTCPALNTLSSGVASVEPTKARCLFIAITLHPSVLRNLHSFSLFLHHFTLSLSLPVPVRGEGQPPARWHLDIHTHTHSAENFMGNRVDSGQRRKN